MGVVISTRLKARLCHRRMMNQLISKLVKCAAVILLVGLYSPVPAQSNRWGFNREKSVVRFDWNCASPATYPTAKLSGSVHVALARETNALPRDADRAFTLDLNGDRKPEYFVPLTCGATGNCNWGVFGLKPDRLLGVVNGQYVYVQRGTGRWPEVITYGHLSAVEGSLTIYRFVRGKYVPFGNGYPINHGDLDLEIQGGRGNRMPKFLETAKPGCRSFGS